MVAGLVLVSIYCVAQTVWFWQEVQMYRYLVMAGGSIDPVELSWWSQVALFAWYASNMSLGLGVLSLAWGVFLGRCRG
jgi:hypothetical protein